MMKYALYQNHLTEGGDDYMAIPQELDNKRIEDIIHQITGSGSILKETECVAVIHDFFKAIAKNLEEGHGFVSDYIRILPGLAGVYDSVDDHFDPERHQKLVNIVASNVLKEAIEKVKVEKVGANARVPQIHQVFDLKSQKSDSVLTPGNLIELSGSRLKLNTESADEGIFLINASDDSEVKVDHVHTNKPSTLLAMLPDNLAAGTYNLEVRNRQEGNKNLSIGVFTIDLIVS